MSGEKESRADKKRRETERTRTRGVVFSLSRNGDFRMEVSEGVAQRIVSDVVGAIGTEVGKMLEGIKPERSGKAKKKAIKKDRAVQDAEYIIVKKESEVGAE